MSSAAVVIGTLRINMGGNTIESDWIKEVQKILGPNSCRYIKWGRKDYRKLLIYYMDIKQLESKKKKRHASSVPKIYMTVEGLVGWLVVLGLTAL